MVYHKINKVLIANRGEIALRIQRTCQRLGIGCAITVSEPDRSATFARFAEEPANISGSAARDSYLSIPKMIEAALNHGCNAVHPGYGFLSEQPAFAEAVQKAGLIFIGPRPECMRQLGDKLLAREQALQNNVPHLVGIEDKGSEEELLSKAEKMGFPLLIKAAAGGGGRGMRVVRSPHELKEAIKTARSEAEKFFSDGRVYLERFIEKPRHVEVQVFGDSHGNIIHLGTRDCSAQRRHQKLIEEAPAPFLSDKLREKIHQAAIRLASSVKYNSAGTVEFLVEDQEFFFLEMNTRIQVEHPVTEAITGLDLIEMQIRVAEGQPLGISQSEVRFTGHAMEFRIYAENPAENFAPALGTIESVERPNLDYLREDFGLNTGDKVTPYYDAMLSKIIVHGSTREQVISRSRVALESYFVRGLPTTLEFHRWIIANKEFRNSAIDIGFIERKFIPQANKFLSSEEAQDSKHEKPTEGMLSQQFFFYEASLSGYQYDIEILHAPDGSFIAIPRDENGKRAKEEFCRRGWMRDGTLKALREEVLEARRPEDIF